MLFFAYSMWVVVLVCILFQFQTIHSIHGDRKHNGSSVITGFSLRMIHRDSPESPLYQPELTDEERTKRLIQMSHTRFQSLFNKRNTNTFPIHSQVIRPSIHTQEHIYLVQIGIGQFDGPTPFYTYFLHLDTASDLTWTQCEGCRLCFPQRDPYFPRSRSRTYKPDPCDECPPYTRCEQDHCTFTKKYADGAFLNGILATETFSFKSERNRVETIPNLVFGCGIEMHNFVEGNNPNNVMSGVLGLSYGPLSFMSQMKSRILNRFSYCLQPLNQQQQSGGAAPAYLRFGEDIVRIRGMVSTPIREITDHPWYYLNLFGLSVGGQRLSIPSGVFQVQEDGSGGTIIDSGTSVTYIVPYAYRILLDAIATFIKANNRNMVRGPPKEPHKECWDRVRDPPRVNLPSVTFHFENNADFVVQSDLVFSKGKRGLIKVDVYCLDIYESGPDDQETVLGAQQQVNQRIIYELDVPQLTFAAVDCSRSN